MNMREREKRLDELEACILKAKAKKPYIQIILASDFRAGNKKVWREDYARDCINNKPVGKGDQL